MKKIYLITALSLIFITKSFSQITLSLPTTKFCPGQIFPVSFTFDPSLTGHTFQVQLSNSSGSFSSGTTSLGTGTSSPTNATMISTNTSPTSLYKIRILDNTAPLNFSNESAVISNNSLSNSMMFYPIDTLGNSNFSTTLCTGSSLKLFTNLTLHDGYGATYQWKNTSNPSVILGTQYKYIVNQAGNYLVTVNKPGCSIGTSPSTGITYSSTISPFLPFPGEIHCTGVTIPIKPTYSSETAVYEWKKNGVVVGNTGIYDVTTSGNYSVKITDNTCLSTQTATFIFGNNIPIQIASSSDTIEVCNGSFANLFINANRVAGNSTLLYRDGLLVSPQPQNVFSNSFGAATGGIYTVKLTEGNCTSISSPVVVKNVSSFNPKIRSDLETTTCLIPPALFSDIPSDFNGQIQWIKDGNNISGATSINYYIPQSTSGSYAVKVTQGTCQGISLPINITSVADNPTYVIVSSPIVCTTGYKLSLLYSRSRYSFIQYQWFKDGVAISGATSATYNATVSGIYKLRVSMSISSCVGFSQDLTVTINANLNKPVIVIDNINKRREKPFQCAGNVISIRTEDINLSPVGLIWKKDGINIPNLTGILSNVVTAFSTGTYTMNYTLGSCTVESNPIKINIGDKQQSLKINSWNDQSTWACGTIPTITDEVLINKGHTVSLPNNYTGFLKNLELNGVLNKGIHAQLKFQTN